MSVERYEGLPYFIVIKEHSGSSSILAGDGICFTKDSKGPKGDVFEIPDRGGYNI